MDGIEQIWVPKCYEMNMYICCIGINVSMSMRLCICAASVYTSISILCMKMHTCGNLVRTRLFCVYLHIM